MKRLVPLAVVLLCTAAAAGHAQSIRARIRGNRGTVVSKTQAVDLTLTVTPVAVRAVQVWVRTAGVIDASGKTLTAYLSPAEAATVKVDQRARAFPVEGRTSMYQARVARVTPEGKRVRVDITMLAPARQGVSRYVVEIVTEAGDFLSVPNEALIEEGDRRVVYVQQEEGRYEPVTVQTGLQGELFTQVVSGVRDGQQVVTFGSFFIDSDYKLKGVAQGQ